MKKKKELCQLCGASMMVNYYSMNKALVGALVKLAKYPGMPVSKLNFTRVQYSVYSKLKWWKLIEKIQDVDGCWKATELGRAFLRGEARVPRTVGYFRNRLVEIDELDTVSIYEVFPTEESKQKYREMMTVHLQKPDEDPRQGSLF